MLRRSYRTAAITALLLTVPVTTHGQLGEQMHIYGYMQNLFYQRDFDFTGFPEGRTIPDTTSLKGEMRTHSLQQLNIFLNKPFEDRFTTFVNLEFQNSFSSDIGSGAFNLQEGWVNYERSEALSVRFGLLLPTFNNLNEIQNRLPLFPYIMRPVVYEVQMNAQVDREDFVPERAFAQVSGTVPVGDLRLDYALHLGNAETSFLDTSKSLGTDEVAGVGFNLFPGEDVTSFKAVGGRIGLRTGNENIVVGLSTTWDKDNRREAMKRSISRLPWATIPALGDVPRVRIGTDASLILGNFRIEGEYIKVLHDLDNTPFPEMSLDKQFFYFNATYETSGNWFAYGGYGFMNNEAYEASQPNSVDKAGFYSVDGGVGYRINYLMTAKLQRRFGSIRENPYGEGNLAITAFALSLIF